MLLSKGPFEKLLFALNAVALCFCANSFLLLRESLWWILPVLLLLVAANIAPLYSSAQFPNKRTHLCNHGVKCLALFLISTVFSIAFHIFLALRTLPDDWKTFLFSGLLCIAVEALIFWNGMICIYTTSIQLGIKLRVLGAIFGFIPPINIILLVRIILTAGRECAFETEKYRIDMERKDQELCKTRYPLLLVHGVCFRDTPLFNYWGRIPAALKQNGATIFYGKHESADSIANSALELESRIRYIVAKTGCEKVNIIAHSKGGLDCRYAIAHLDIGKHVASLTTVNTPHRGCLYADHLLEQIPDGVEQKVANTYNSAMRKLGDETPDFLAAMYDLTSQRCRELDAQMPVPEGIYCQSIGSIQTKADSGKFPMNATYLLARPFDGPNDGLVGEHSFRFGQNYTLLTTKGKRGITHADIIDMNRENIPDFDVREFYVQLVSKLKERGL